MDEIAVSQALTELANTTRTSHVGFNTRSIPSLKIYAQMSSWMTLGRLNSVAADAYE